MEKQNTQQNKNMNNTQENKNTQNAQENKNMQNAQENKNVSVPAPAATAPAVVIPENKNQADFKFEVEEYNFGTIKQGESVNYDFNFTNIGKEPIIISESHGSCGCTVPQWPKEPIKKGEKNQIKVTFNSTGKMGMQDKTVTITSNAKNSPKVLHLKGTVEQPTPVADPAKADAPKN